MEKKIVYTKNFETSVNSTKDWLEKQWSFEMAEKFILELYELVNLISTQPKIGSVSQREKSVRKILLSKHKRIYYRINGKTITLLDLFDTRQNPKRNKYE
ncbi:MAG: type II toxin-antitoxin system RelE/ParE family toxin [Ginsengibacter sp.]